MGSTLPRGSVDAGSPGVGLKWIAGGTSLPTSSLRTAATWLWVPVRRAGDGGALSSVRVMPATHSAFLTISGVMAIALGLLQRHRGDGALERGAADAEGGRRGQEFARGRGVGGHVGSLVR